MRIHRLAKSAMKMDLLFSLVSRTRRLPNNLVIWENLQFLFVNCSSNMTLPKSLFDFYKCLLVLFVGSQPPSIQTIRFLMRTHWPAKSAIKWICCFHLSDKLGAYLIFLSYGKICSSILSTVHQIMTLQKSLFDF